MTALRIVGLHFLRKVLHVERRGSVVACATYKIVGSIARWAEFAVDAVLLGKAFTHTCTLSTQE